MVDFWSDDCTTALLGMLLCVSSGEILCSTANTAPELLGGVAVSSATTASLLEFPCTGELAATSWLPW